MSKEERILNYYMLCNKLKDIVRSGWRVWNIKRERVESIAEHIYGVQMLAIAMKSEYQYNVNLEKVILKLCKDFKYKPKQNFKGSTECFQYD